MKLNNDIVLSIIKRRFPDAVLNHGEPHGMLTMETTREQIIPLLDFVKHDADLQANFLTSLCGIHYPDNPGKELGVVYHLHSFRNNFRFRVKVFFPIDDPVVPTATTVWPAANWMERETYDFFGVLFTGHPNLKRILNVEDLDVFPLRKEYRLEDGTRTDKDDRFFGRQGHVGREFD
ncbi:MAG: NADH-quinone oxidoreductase subunit C [Saprospiraceae bacterium]|nr:NADH-quinone oxidoreductase subunit C [Saprospiraceae bacterium]